MCKIKNKVLLSFALALLFCISAAGQFWDSATGLLQMPSADMNRDGTVMVTNCFINKHSISEIYWGYHTFEYGININLWSRLELGYVCVILDGKRKPGANERDKIMFNQDRHFNAKALILKEGEFGLSWMPALVVGLSDPVTAGGGEDYSERHSGFFHRDYIVASKHLSTRIGTIGLHLGYQYSKRYDYPMNGPCAAIDWVPKWLDNNSFALKAIAEYDSRSMNIGLIASFMDDHIEAMFEIMAMKWINFGIRYKMRLKT